MAQTIQVCCLGGLHIQILTYPLFKDVYSLFNLESNKINISDKFSKLGDKSKDHILYLYEITTTTHSITGFPSCLGWLLFPWGKTNICH